MAVGVTRPDLPELREYMEYLEDLWDTRILTNNGRYVRELADKLRDYLHVGNIVLVDNGTSALQLSLRALGIRGEVITTPFTFATTTNVLIWEGIKPVFADIDRETFNIDPAEIERRISSETEALLAVHVYGNPSDVGAIEKIASEYGLKVIYDAAHSFGVGYRNRSILEYGDASTLSFHATKTFHTVEGGAIVTGNPSMKTNLELMRNHGIESEESMPMPGINAKMDEFRAVMGILNLRNAARYTAIRKMIYGRYLEGLDGYVAFQKIVTDDYNYAYFPIILGSRYDRDIVYSALKQSGILARKYFFPLTSDLGYVEKIAGKHKSRGDLENSRYISDRVLCLPIFPDLREEDQSRIISTTKRVLSQLRLRV